MKCAECGREIRRSGQGYVHTSEVPGRTDNHRAYPDAKIHEGVQEGYRQHIAEMNSAQRGAEDAKRHYQGEGNRRKGERRRNPYGTPGFLNRRRGDRRQG